MWRGRRRTNRYRPDSGSCGYFPDTPARRRPTQPTRSHQSHSPVGTSRNAAQHTLTQGAQRGRPFRIRSQASVPAPSATDAASHATVPTLRAPRRPARTSLQPLRLTFDLSHTIEDPPNARLQPLHREGAEPCAQGPDPCAQANDLRGRDSKRGVQSRKPCRCKDACLAR